MKMKYIYRRWLFLMAGALLVANFALVMIMTRILPFYLRLIVLTEVICSVFMSSPKWAKTLADSLITPVPGQLSNVNAYIHKDTYKLHW